MSEAESFWECSEQVENFADREPDRRLMALLEDYAAPARIRVLDLGCAGGRNTVALAERGFDVHALDASAAMVEKTRARLVRLVGAEEAKRRVRRGRMDDLSDYASESFQLVVALGVYHSATDQQEWERALQETARVLAPAGSLLVANFSPRCEALGQDLRRVERARHVYEGHEAGPMYLMEAVELDAEMARHGLLPDTASQTVFKQTRTGQRVTVNALYRKR